MSVDREGDVDIVSVLAHLGTALNSHLFTSSGTFVCRVAIVVQVLTFTAQVFGLAQLLNLLGSGSASSIDVSPSRLVVLRRYCHVSRHNLGIHCTIVT